MALEEIWITDGVYTYSYLNSLATKSLATGQKYQLGQLATKERPFTLSHFPHLPSFYAPVNGTGG